jgi:anti-sigma factor RsiW
MGKLETDMLDRYLDGELSSKETERVAKMVEASPESQATLDKTKKLGELIRLSNNEQCHDVSFEGLADRVLKKIEVSESPLPILIRLRVWLGEFFEHRKTVWIPAATICTAAALTLLMLPLSQVSPTPQHHPSNNGIALHSAIKAAGGSTIASVDFGAAAGTTYNVRIHNGATVGVVWIEENP